MKQDFSPNNLIATSNSDSDDGVHLRQAIGALYRHKILITKIASFALLLSGIYAIAQKTVWEGQFEIVLASGKGPIVK